MRKTNGQRGFTLIELMMVVGIIGAICAIAIPNFIDYQARSRRSEAFTNVAAMANAQKAFQAERNYYHDSMLDYPDVTNYGGEHGTHRMPWDSDAQMAFGELGWAPEGEVFYSYATYTEATGAGCGGCPACFTAAAYGNVDGGAMEAPQLILYVHPGEVGGATVSCNEPILNQGAAADSDGNPIFDAVAARSNSDY